MNPVSINEVSTFQWNFVEDITRYSTLGFQGIGVWRHKISDYCDHTVSQMLHNAGLKVSSIQWVGGFTGSDGLSFSEAIEDAHAAIRTAGILHADCLIVHPGAANGHTRNHARRLLHTAMTELVPVAQDYGVRMAIEPMPIDGTEFTFLDQLRDALDFVVRYPSSNLGLVFDLFGMTSPTELESELQAHIDRVALVQLSDRCCNGRGEWQRCLPGSGTLPLIEWLRAFRHAGYRGYYEIEIFGESCCSLGSYRLLDELARRLPAMMAAAQTPEPIAVPAPPSGNLSASGRW